MTLDTARSIILPHRLGPWTWGRGLKYLIEPDGVLLNREFGSGLRAESVHGILL